MIAVFCGRCKIELTAPGALLFSPPTDTDSQKVLKLHLCMPCWNFLQRVLPLPIRKDA